MIIPFYRENNLGLCLLLSTRVCIHIPVKNFSFYAYAYVSGMLQNAATSFIFRKLRNSMFILFNNSKVVINCLRLMMHEKHDTSIKIIKTNNRIGFFGSAPFTPCFVKAGLVSFRTLLTCF